MDPGVKPAQPADDTGAASSLLQTTEGEKGNDQAYLEPCVLSSQSLKGFHPRKPSLPLTNPKISSSLSSSATDASAAGAAVQKENGASHGRSSRKSKANALALMSAQSASVQADIEAAKRLQAGQAASNDTHLQNASNTTTADHLKSNQPADLLQGPGPHAHPARQAAATPKSPALDFDTLALNMPPGFPERTENRPFGFDHCPVFHPSPLEFTKPMEYIEKVSRQVMNEHGILKVVPPQGWKPPFSLDTQTFRFKTRLQRLNSLEASARANINFLEQLSAFHSQRPGSQVSIPIIQDRKLDLWLLRKCVQELGGYSVVSNQRQWHIVVQNLGFDPRSDMWLGQKLKRAYTSIIKPFEIWLETVKVAGSSSSHSSPAPKSNSASASGTSTPATNKAFESAVTAEQVQQASSRLNDALSSNAGMTADAEMSAPVETLQQSSIPVGEACEVCHQDNEHTRMILCDDCDRAYHMFCLAPPLESVPRGTWICDGCILSTGADYGFDSGKEHTLGSYRAKADDFKRHWVNESNQSRSKKGVKEEPFTAQDWERLRHTNPEDWEALLKAEHRVEEDFWRLVESPDVSVEVEYGADLHSAKYGSGFPCLERHPQQPYARDAWNLNNLPIVGGSLLRYIRSDVAGMTNPWLYAGMIFSTFAWHKEDHYTYSINYHHFGETKTWYGIPTDDDDKLEAAMTKAAPELFEQQPDLMFQLVTLLSPHRLKSEGVRVSACDQRAGEFVITLPRAYHAGFNHGFNVCEAVNFCLPDWLPHGLACANHYAEIRKPPVFSHDELVCTIYQHERNPRSSKWLLPFFQEMVDRELASRQEVRKLRPDIIEILHDVDLQDENTQCSHCKVYCHLSQVFSEHLPAVSCAKHVQIVHGDEPVLMRVRYMDADLLAFCKRVKGRAEKLNYASYQANYDEPSGESRKSSRKRVLSAAALEAAGAEVVPVAQRQKVTHPNYDESLIPDTIDEETASTVSRQPEESEDSRPAAANGSKQSEPITRHEAAGSAAVPSLPQDPVQSRNGTTPNNDEQHSAFIIDPALS